MGAAQSYITPAAALAGFVVAGTIVLGVTSLNSVPSVVLEGDKKKTNKKKKTDIAKFDADLAAASQDLKSTKQTPIIVEFPPVIPGQFEPVSTETTSKAKKSKKKKSKVPAVGVDHSESSTGQPAPGASTLIPLSSSTSSSKSKAKAKAKTKGSTSSTIPIQAQAEPTPTPPIQPIQQAKSDLNVKSKPSKQTISSIDTDSSWTTVEPRRRNAGRDVNIVSTGEGSSMTTSDVGPNSSTSSPIAERTEDEEFIASVPYAKDVKKPLAERMLPKPRKTGVEDMLQTPDHPVLARVMRVRPKPGAKPPSGFSWADYEDVDTSEDTNLVTSVGGIGLTESIGESGLSGQGGGSSADGEDDGMDDGGWGVVKSRSRSKIQGSGSSSTSIVIAQKASDARTKKQRQNAARREVKKAETAAAEKERLATLAAHRRELEAERIKEQYKKGDGKSKLSGGMQAKVDPSGRLVWD